MTASSVSSTRAEGCAEEGRIKAVYRGEEMRRLVGQDGKGQVRTVDVMILDEGRGIIPLRGRGRALVHSNAIYAFGALSYETVCTRRG